MYSPLISLSFPIATSQPHFIDESTGLERLWRSHQAVQKGRESQGCFWGFGISCESCASKILAFPTPSFLTIPSPPPTFFNNYLLCIYSVPDAF